MWVGVVSWWVKIIRYVFKHVLVDSVAIGTILCSFDVKVPRGPNKPKHGYGIAAAVVLGTLEVEVLTQ